MRLGLVRYRYAAGGGAEKTLLMLARGLADRGHEVHVGVSEWLGEQPTQFKVHLIAAGSKPAAFANAARNHMDGLKLDTWLSLERIPGSPMLRTGDGCHAAWLKRRAPHQNTLESLYSGFRPKHRELLELERRSFAWPGLKKVIANSKLVGRELNQYYGLAQDSVELIYNGVDRAFYEASFKSGLGSQVRSSMALRERTPVILFLGSGFQRKGLAFAIKAIKHLPEAQLWVAGRDRTTAFQVQARRLGLTQRVRFLGQCKDNAGLLAAADVMCLPTIYDPCANSVLEALAAQTPVVTTWANGAAELMDQAVNGYVVDEPQNDDALAGALQKALQLKTPFEHRVPDFDEMIQRTAASMEQVARGSQGGTG